MVKETRPGCVSFFVKAIFWLKTKLKTSVKINFQ